jgi:hypothetical protein
VADIETIIQLALTQRGKRYVFGAQPANTDPNPVAFDCSSFVRWCCNRSGLNPPMDMTSQYQEIHCRQLGTMISIDEAVGLRGALLFNHRDPAGNPHVPSPPVDPGYYSHAHIAFSIGGGQTIEARSTQLGVIVAGSGGRGWTAAARVPGATYGSPLPPPPPTPSPPPAGFPAPRADKPYLRRGATGPSVAEMQRLLIATGLVPELAGVGATGNFLDITVRALRTFQGHVRVTYGDTRMVVDAECGPVTWAWLYHLAS